MAVVRGMGGVLDRREDAIDSIVPPTRLGYHPVQREERDTPVGGDLREPGHGCKPGVDRRRSHHP